jgi:hypothetical protein
MTTLPLNPRDLAIIADLRATARRGANYSYGEFHPAAKANIARTRDEYVLESCYVSFGKLSELQLRALRTLAAPRTLPYAHFNDDCEILAMVLRDDEGLRAPYAQCQSTCRTRPCAPVARMGRVLAPSAREGPPALRGGHVRTARRPRTSYGHRRLVAPLIESRRSSPGKVTITPPACSPE